MRSNRDLLSQKKKETLIQKMISLSTITLVAQEASAFILGVWDLSKLKNNARLVQMESATRNVRALGIGTGRILHPAGTFSSSDYVKEFKHNLIPLATEEFRACVIIYDSDLEDINVGSAAEFKRDLLEIVKRRLAKELDELYWIADKEGLSGFADTDARCRLNGWRYQMDHSQATEAYENKVTGSTIILDASNTVTAAAADFELTTTQGIAETAAAEPFETEFKFDLMLEVLPSEYKLGGLSSLRYFCNDQIVSRYHRKLSRRATGLGDSIIQGKAPMQYGMVPIVDLPLMPTIMKIDTVDDQKEALRPDGDLTDCVLTHEKNFVIGVQKQIQMETERSAADRANLFFFTLRVDAKMEDVHAVVFTKRLKVA